MSVSVEALAALGAELRLRQEGLEGDPRVRALLGDVVNAVDPRLLDGIDSDQEASVLALIQTIFRQAVDLLERPGRVPAWSYQDPITLARPIIAIFRTTLSQSSVIVQDQRFPKTREVFPKILK